MYAPIPMIPGPVTVPDTILRAMAQDYGSGQVEGDFLALYHQTGRLLAQLMGTQHDVVIMTGEGMLALWAGLKSCLAPGDKVLSLGTGVFGDGIGDMAASIGCEVKKISFAYDESLHDFDMIEEEIVRFAPKMITAVHCETPSGTFNPIAEIGARKHKHKVPLLYVDAVASVGGAPVCMDQWHVDLLLGGSQKCLSVPPSISFLGISPAAWEYIDQRDYVGYDALKPWRTVQSDGRCPYTPYWHGVAALHQGAREIVDTCEACFVRHEDVAAFCRTGLQDMGIKLWPKPGALAASTVTAAYVPQGFTWIEWQTALRARGLRVAGSFGPMAGKVFRLGHMGSQADKSLVISALDAIKATLGTK